MNFLEGDFRFQPIDFARGDRAHRIDTAEHGGRVLASDVGRRAPSYWPFPIAEEFDGEEDPGHDSRILEVQAADPALVVDLRKAGRVQADLRLDDFRRDAFQMELLEVLHSLSNELG